MRKRAPLIICLLAGAGLLVAACGTTAPGFVSGDVQPTGDAFTQYTVNHNGIPALGRLAQFTIPTAAALGKARVNLFIPDHWLDSPTDGLIDVIGLVSPAIQLAGPRISGIGDNRSFDSTTDAFASRVAIELDFGTGTGRVYANPSCIDVHTLLGPGSSPSQMFCRDAVKFSSTIGDPDSNGFRVASTTGAGGRIDVYLLMSAMNAYSRVGSFTAPYPYDCAIDVGFHLWTDQGTLRTESWEPFGAAVDTFPSSEAYWYDGSGDPVQTMYQHTAAGGVGALCDHTYHS